MDENISGKHRAKKLRKELKKFKVDARLEIEPPKVAWGIRNVSDEDVSILGTLGNFSLIIGKAKSRKSFFLNIVSTAAASKGKFVSRIKSVLPKSKNEIIYFDTEQGKYHVQLILKRICRQLQTKNPKNLNLYGLRSLTPVKRLELIEYAIYQNDNIGIVVIDGIKDLITSINSEEEATEISSKLLKWTEELNIHIICVLHQNKGDNNARGHLGSELTHKAETVLSVTKSQEDQKISIVEAEMCRNKEPENFAFEIIEGIPKEVENYEERTVKKIKNKFDPLEASSIKLFELLNIVFAKEQEYKYTDLQMSLKIAFKEKMKKNIGNNTLRDVIALMKNKKWIIQEKPRGTYKQGTFNKTQ